jgi:hypothetical protein
MTSTASSTITIRPAGSADKALVARLAELDSQRAPDGDVLIAFHDDDAVAAISVDSGQIVADPFSPTISIVELLRTTASRNGASVSRPQRVHRYVRKLRVAA